MTATPNAPWAAVESGGRGLPTQAAARAIKLVVLDVDGVLTDGRIVLDANGTETKFFDVRDGTGLTLLEKVGLPAALLTGRNSKVVELRARELKVPNQRVKQSAKVKLPVFQDLLRENNVAAQETLFIGDDLIDIPVLEQCGIAACPSDAHPEVRELCHVAACAPGGRGAVRAICEWLLKTRADGTWERAVGLYLRRIDGVPG